MKTCTHPPRGFSLVELAIVLSILGLLSIGALSALRIQTERARLAETRELLADAREALLNFAAVSGRLPCPAPDAGGLAAGTCSATLNKVIKGHLPWQTLGLISTDPWGQSLRYAVVGGFTASPTLNTKAAITVKPYFSGSEALAFIVWSTGADAQDGSAGEGSSTVSADPAKDDQVVWVSRFILLGRMLEAGQDIPAAHTP